MPELVEIREVPVKVHHKDEQAAHQKSHEPAGEDVAHALASHDERDRAARRGGAERHEPGVEAAEHVLREVHHQRNGAEGEGKYLADAPPAYLRGYGVEQRNDDDGQQIVSESKHFSP